MKTIQLITITFCFLLLSCSKNEDVSPSSQQNSTAKVASINLRISQSAGTFWLNESDALKFSTILKDEKGTIINNYSGKITFTANGKELATNQYDFTEEGTFTFKASVDGIESESFGNYIVKNPQKELDKIILTNSFYSKYAVNHTLIGTNPKLSVKGLDKNGIEIPIKKGLKTSIENESINLDNYTFSKAGSIKITMNAYGKQIESTFEVRQNRTFDVVRIPIMFHFCQPSPYTHPTTKQTDAQFIELAIEQLKNGKKLEQLNAMFRNKYVNNVQEFDPNASDTFIEFYLAEKDPQGNTLKEKGVNRLNFMRPYVALNETYVYNEAQRQYEITLANELSKWNPNTYFNVIVENYGNWGYAGIAKMPMMDNASKSFVLQEFFNLPYINTNIDKLAWGNTNTRNYADHVRLAGATNLLVDSPGVDGTLYQNSVLSHEIGHAFGLQHSFGIQENCQDSNHSDGLYDTPRQISADYFTSCDGIKFTQRNLMNYISVPTRGSFTYDQVTVMRSRIEAGFGLPTPRNRGKSSMRIAGNLSGSNITIID